MSKRIHRCSRSSVALVVLSMLGSFAQAQAVKNFDLPAQSLGETLRAIAGQTNSNILFDGDLVSGLSVKALKGQATTQEALQKVLTGTGLTFKYLDDKTVTIVPVGASTSSYRATSAGTAALGLAGQSAVAQAPETGERRLVLEEIIVTAQKRQETLREIPQSVTVVGGATLERLQADNFQDYVGLIPGLNFESTRRGQSRLTLRGINTGGVASTVAVYLDEVPFGSSSGLVNGSILAADFDTLDIERLEVLRGPQGTLYGASSLGGVLKFVTKQPQTDAFTAEVSTSIESVSGGDLSYAGTGVVNVPLSERFAVRASGFYRREGGFIDSIGNNPIFEFGGGPTVIIPGSRVAEDVNELDVYGGRLSALFQASDMLSVHLTALAQNIDNASPGFFEVDPATLEPLYGDLTVSEYYPPSDEFEYRVYSATLDWDLGFASLVSSSSYGSLDFNSIIDTGFGLAPLVTALVGDPVTRPLTAINVSKDDDGTRKLAQELRLASPDNDRFEWLIGAFYTEEKSELGGELYAVEAGTTTLAADIPVLSETSINSTFEEYAGFANATWHLTPRFDLSFGGRWSRNEQDAVIVDGGLLTPPRVISARSGENVFTYSVAPRFELSDMASLYARVATGYRPGGPNVVPPLAPPDAPRTYDADRLTNYEVGLKADLFDRTVSLDVSVYYLDWEDIQLVGSIDQFNFNDNGGTAVSKGVEFTAQALPVEGLILSLTGAYADAYLTQDTDPAAGGFDGDPLPYIPDWSVNLSADYEWPVFNDSTAYVGSSVRYVGEQTTEFGVRTPDGNLRQAPTYEVVDLRAGLRAGRWSIEAYARNVGNEKGRTYIYGGIWPNDAIATGVIRPRTIGLSLGVNF